MGDSDNPVTDIDTPPADRTAAGGTAVGGEYPGGSWHHDLMELALACAGSFVGEEPRRIREMHELLARAPDYAQRAGLTRPDPAQVERLLAAGAGDCAVLALFGGPAGYLLSRGGGGQHLASVILPGAAEEVTASGDSLALALISALALALGQAASTAEIVPAAYAADGMRLN